MLKAKLLQRIATGATGLVLLIGVGGVSAGSFHHFPPKDEGTTSSYVQTNDNNVNLNNTTDQTALTGEAKVIAGDQKDDHKPVCFDFRHCGDYDNNSDEVAVLGDATTGAATNENMTAASVAITNDSDCACAGAVEGVSSTVELHNNNNVMIDNHTNQTAISGDAMVIGGSEGSATTGDAYNTNSTALTVSIAN